MALHGRSLPTQPRLLDRVADRTVLTPHTAAQTVEAVDGMGAAPSTPFSPCSTTSNPRIW